MHRINISNIASTINIAIRKHFRDESVAHLDGDLMGHANYPVARSTPVFMVFAAIAVTTVSMSAASASAQAASPQSTSARGAPSVATTPVTLLPLDRPIESRGPVPSKLQKRGAALKDAEIGKRALQLSPVQEHAMAAVRARYSPDIKALIARLNALLQQQGTAEPATTTVKATEDTLRHVIGAEHAALDSLISPDQRQRYLQAMRQAHDEASAPPPGTSVINPLTKQ